MFGDKLVIEGVKGHSLLSLGDLGVHGAGWVGRVRCPDGPAGTFGASSRGNKALSNPGPPGFFDHGTVRSAG